jgi:hypothetical protein
MKKSPPGGGPRIDAKDNKRSHKLLSTNIARTARGIRSGRPEQGIQRAIVDHLRWRAVPGVFALHVPLGGYRRPIEAAIFKSIGVVAGVPDIIIIYGGQCFGLELKADRGRLTNVQRDVHERMREAGALVAVAHGIDAALAQLTEWRLLRGAPS